MVSGTAASLAAAVVFKAATTTAAAVYPLRLSGHLHCLSRLRCILDKLYTLPDSNLDVWLVAVVESLVLLALLAHVRSPARPRLAIPPYAQIRRAIRFSAGLAELLFLAKAVAVAVAGRDALLPLRKHPGHAGLLCMYGALVAAVLASFVEAWACCSLARRWEAERDAAASDAEQPLLGPKADGAAKDNRGATVGALLRMAAPDTPLLAVAFTAGSVAALGQALIPYYTGRIIDYASIEPNPAAFRATTVRMLAVAAACAVFTGIRGGLFTVAMTRLNVRLRTALFGSLMAQEVGFFDVSRAGEITSRLAADTTTVSDQVCLNLNVMLRSATQAAMVLAFMLSASWRLTVVTFILVPCVLAMCKVYGRYYRKMSKAVQTELAEANSVADEALSTMATIKAHGAEASVEAAYASKLAAFYRLQRREAAAYGAYMGANTFLSAAVVAVVLFYGGSLVLGGAMSAGALVSFMLYQQSLSGAFQALGDVFSALAAAVGAADKVVELMQRTPRVPPGGTLRPPGFEGRVELAAVCFAYPARPALPVLRGLSLAIRPGEIVALVGPSGGGKSSIVKLLLRYYLPQGGAVLMDGRDVGAYDPRWLRRRVGLVSQEPVLYARSILRNIMLGLEPADGVPPSEVPTQAEVEEAARLANAHDFISALPQGYATDCGEKGVQLSGGQKQRIAIARALLRRPTVLLLDEATSALDADSEAAVQEALDRTMAGRTVLVIAHRLSTVVDAHRIAVVAGGAVVEEGTHAALLEAGGAYAGLVRRQITRASSSASLARSASTASDLPVLR